MNSSFFMVLNSLFHSRKFQAFSISLIIAILIPLVNKWTGIGLDPQVVTSLVLASVGGGAAYGVSTAIEDGKKAQANATVLTASVAAQAGQLKPDNVANLIKDTVNTLRR